MNEHDQDRIRQLLKQALPPMTGAEAPRDLWPIFLRRLNDKPAQSLLWLWFDWALAGGLVAFAVFAPASIPVLLYYL
ncbi:MAG TPA: hypothetical protein VFE01_06330 [Terracidiphilus sp.]|jgi:hypothetical protein|nr:hypothetical protein [Terracidiphilus sp.]